MEAYDRSLDKEDMAKRLKLLGVDVEAAMQQAEGPSKSTSHGEFAATGKTAPAGQPAAPQRRA